MKVYIVFKAYWMYQPEIDSIFLNEEKAKIRKAEILKSEQMARSYIHDYEIIDSLPWKTINEYREFINKSKLGE